MAAHFLPPSCLRRLPPPHAARFLPPSCPLPSAFCPRGSLFLLSTPSGSFKRQWSPPPLHSLLKRTHAYTRLNICLNLGERALRCLPSNRKLRTYAGFAASTASFSTRLRCLYCPFKRSLAYMKWALRKAAASGALHVRGMRDTPLPTRPH